MCYPGSGGIPSHVCFLHHSSVVSTAMLHTVVGSVRAMPKSVPATIKFAKRNKEMKKVRKINRSDHNPYNPAVYQHML